MMSNYYDYPDSQTPLPEDNWRTQRASRWNRQSRPHIRPPMTAIEIIAIVVVVLGLLSVIVPLAIWWPTIPNIIPTHFGIDGQVNAYGSKLTLLLFPIISIAITILLQTLCQFPWVFNYPVQITAENAVRQYTYGRILLRVVNALVWLFAAIQWQSVEIARGAARGFDPTFNLILIGFAVGMPVIMLALVTIWALRSRA